MGQLRGPFTGSVPLSPNIISFHGPTSVSTYVLLIRGQPLLPLMKSSCHAPFHFSPLFTKSRVSSRASKGPLSTDGVLYLFFRTSGFYLSMSMLV